MCLPGGNWRLCGVISAWFAVPPCHRMADGWPRAATSPRDAVKLWDLVAHRELLSLQGEGQYFMHVAFSPDGNTLVAVSLDGIAHLWRAPSWAEIEAAEKGAGGAMNPYRRERRERSRLDQGLRSFWSAVASGARHRFGFPRSDSGVCQRIRVDRQPKRRRRWRSAGALHRSASASPSLSSLPSVRSPPVSVLRLHPHRVAGRHRDHCDPGRAAVARLGQGQGRGAVDPVHEQPQATATRLAPVFRRSQRPAGAQLFTSARTVIGAAYAVPAIPGCQAVPSLTTRPPEFAKARCGLTRKSEGIYRCPSDRTLWPYGAAACAAPVQRGLERVPERRVE